MGRNDKPKNTMRATEPASTANTLKVSAPTVGKVTHHNVELVMVKNDDNSSSAVDPKTKVSMTLQQQDRHGGWFTVYTGYSKQFTVEDLSSWTPYNFRVKLTSKGVSTEWSSPLIVTTAKEPLNGEHLHKAIFLENISKLEDILEIGQVNPDIPDKYGFTPLMQASQKGYIEMIEILVKYGADPNYQNEAGKTALMLAAYNNKLASVKELRFHGACYNYRDKGGSGALHWSMDGGNCELVGWMIDDGAPIESVDVNGWTPLLRCAAITGNADIAQILVRSGTDVNRKDKDGKSPLMMAVMNGHEHLTQVLLNSGADYKITTEYGKTVMDMAVSMDKKRMIRVLEDYVNKVANAKKK